MEGGRRYFVRVNEMKVFDRKTILEQITRFYMESGDFNGIPVRELGSRLGTDDRELFETLIFLIEEELISIVYGDLHPNPHIKALPDRPKSEQIAKLETANMGHACVYPLRRHLEDVVEESQYEGKPFTFMLALGTPQLAFKPFDLSVLEHYRNDPRYYYSADDIQGRITVSDDFYECDAMEKREKIHLQTFGFCYNSQLDRAVAVFVRYLSDLSPEHQQIWYTKMLTGEYSLHPDYFRSSILGQWHEKMPICEAFLEEMKVINKMAELMERPALFRKVFSGDEKPREFCLLVRPTLKEFNNFVLMLDKMISDNINRDFFKNEVPYETEVSRNDGKVEVQHKASLTIMEDWIRKYFWINDPKDLNEMFETFRKIRRDRQKPAHALDENIFDQKYFHEQRDLLIKAYRAIKMLRLLLGSHPKVKSGAYEIDEYLQEGNIWTR